jgi:hypothetical protein
MVRIGRWLAVSAGLLGCATATAQEVTVSGGAVAGRIISGSTVAEAQDSSEVLTTPPTGAFALTLVCSTGAVRFVGSTFGFIARPTDSCLDLRPGVALPPEETVLCFNDFDTAEDCQASGVLSQR